MFGFIGSQVFPKDSLSFIEENLNLIGEFHGWPHILLLYIYLNHKRKILCLDIPVVIQSADGRPAQYWRSEDFFFVEYLKYKMPFSKTLGKKSIFNILMFIRELYSAHSFAFLLSYRLLHKDHFRSHAVKKYLNELSKSPMLTQIMSMGHVITIVTLKLLPIWFLLAITPHFLQYKILKLGARASELPSDYDALQRKL